VHAVSLDLDAPVRRTVFTDDDGAAEVAGALGLPMRLLLTRPGKAPLSQVLDAAPRDLTIEMAEGKSAKGVVPGREGRDWLEGAEVVVYTVAGTKRTLTDAEGAFELSDLA